MHASVETLDALAVANIIGLSENARDEDGHTANECFLKCRSAHCAVARQELDAERKSWNALMRSVGGYGKVLFDESHQHQEPMAKFSNDPRDKQDECCLADEFTSGDMKEDDFVDAEDGYGKD